MPDVRLGLHQMLLHRFEPRLQTMEIDADECCDAFRDVSRKRRWFLHRESGDIVCAINFREVTELGAVGDPLLWIELLPLMQHEEIDIVEAFVRRDRSKRRRARLTSMIQAGPSMKAFTAALNEEPETCEAWLAYQHSALRRHAQRYLRGYEGIRVRWRARRDK